MGFSGLWGEYWATAGILLGDRLARPGEPGLAVGAGAGAGEGGRVLFQVVFRFLLAGVIVFVVSDISVFVVALRVPSLIIMAAAVAAVSSVWAWAGNRKELAIIKNKSAQHVLETNPRKTKQPFHASRVDQAQSQWSDMSRNDRAAYQLHSCQASVDSRPTDGNDREHFLPYTLSLTGSAPDAADAGQLGEAARDTRASAAAAVGFRRSRRLFRVAAVASISSWPLAFVLAERCSLGRCGSGCWRATEPASLPASHR